MIAVIAVGAVILFAFSYLSGNRSSLVFSRLEEALNMAPDPFDFPFTRQPIEFADYSGSRRAAGLDQSVGFQAYLSLPEENRRSLYRGLPTPGGRLRDFQTALYETLAIDLYGFDLGVWVNQPDLRMRNFMALQGAYNKEEIVNKLLGLGYKETQHGDVKYYRLFEEPKRFEEAKKVDLGHPLGTLAPYVNRVAFLDDKLLLGTDDLVIESLIDVQLGKVPSMRADRGYVRLARSSVEGVLGGVILNYEWLRDTWLRSPEQYLEVPDNWGTLGNYRLVLFGYRQTGESGQVILSLYGSAYGSAKSAERNAPELENRWKTFRPGAYQGNLVTDFCSPFSTTVIERTDKSSVQSRGRSVRFATGPYEVLNATCQIIEREGPDVAAQGPGLWRTLYEAGQLTFLVRFDDL